MIAISLLGRFMVRRRPVLYLGLVIFGFLFGMANIFTGHILNALFLNAFGTPGTAVIVQSEQTNSTLNDQYIWEYHAVMKTADGRDVKITFDTMSASIYPIRNAILIPPEKETFVVKYIPGVERNVVIMSDASNYGKQRLIYEARAPVEKAAAQLAVSPSNPEFIAEYRDALQTFVRDYRDRADPALIQDYEQQLAALESKAN
ncbi:MULTISPECIES: hypothetical protein [unclassified Pseudoxanthomonas]|uniref:hypothetical protein n=1 Tax=unclassified Pseudoxanthomonas TaxID=2645906 RepID=UPI00307886F7